MPFTQRTNTTLHNPQPLLSSFFLPLSDCHSFSLTVCFASCSSSFKFRFSRIWNLDFFYMDPRPKFRQILDCKLSAWASHCRNHVIELKADFTGDYKHFGHWIKQFFPFFFCSSPCCTSKDEESDSKYYHSIEKCYSKACRVCQTYVRTQMEKCEVEISEE